MNKNTTTIVIVLIVLAIGAWLIFRNKPAAIDAPINDSYKTDTTINMGSDVSTPATSTSTSGTTVDVGVNAGTTVGSTKSFTVAGSNFKFSPSALSVKKGDTVKITFTNSGGTHNFNIDAFHVATKMLKTGESETVQFVADKTGSFEYYCSVGSHRAMGMKGTLTVTQ